ncbi:uncharacterized protein LOC117613565 [Prunus dulcis]|nr:uncharacterized protein LOC117613565 [Prunus dulcis]
MAFQLPRFFALKSKKNEKHLQYIHQDIKKLHGFLQFSGDNVVSPYAQFQMVAATSCNRRLVHIRSCYNNKYLVREDKDHWWIVARADEPQEDQSLWSCTLYEPQLVQPQADNNGSIPLIRLRHVQLGHYLKLLSANDFQACLFAHQATPDTQKFDVFTVKELVLSRTISDLNFRLAHARIYNHNIDLLVATGEAENCTLQPANALILLSYIDTKESTWITSVDNVAFTSLIPTTLTSDTLFAVEHNDGGIIGVLGKFNGVYQCGQTHTSQTTIESRFPVVVPPMSKVKVSLLATKASCNIPFYYSQQDNLISPHPRTITYHKEGGVYTGVSFYNFKHKKEEEPLAG